MKSLKHRLRYFELIQKIEIILGIKIERRYYKFINELMIREHKKNEIK